MILRKKERSFRIINIFYQKSIDNLKKHAILASSLVINDSFNPINVFLRLFGCSSVGRTVDC